MDQDERKEVIENMSRDVEDATQIIQDMRVKLHEERKYWRDRIKAMEDQQFKEIAEIRMVSSLVLASLCKEFGSPKGEEWILDILKPKQEEGKTWLSRVEPLDDGHTWRIHSKKIDISREQN